MTRLGMLCASGCAALVVGCVADSGDGSSMDDLTSKDATFLELSFDGSVVAKATDSASERKKSIVTQLFYLSGELDKTHSAHGQFAFVELSDLTVEALEDGLEKVTYKAKLPVAWPKYRSIPETYRVVVPSSVEPTALSSFNSKYKGSCAKAKYGSDTLWYDFKPVTTTGCEIDEGDALDVMAGVRKHPRITTDKRPESERFWQDDVLRMVLVHGTDSASSYNKSDTGVRQYDKFKDKLKSAYPEHEISEGDTNYQIYDDWTFSTTIPRLGGGEGTLVVNLLLTTSLKYIGSSFDARFGELSKDADIISYGGHSGLSKNIKAIAHKEKANPKQYQVWFLDGCSTFAYLDTSLVDRRREMHGAEDDPYGTKYLDLVLNAQPAPWYTGSASQWTVLSHLADDEHHSFMEIVDELGSSATPVVSGEEDNPSINE